MRRSLSVIKLILLNIGFHIFHWGIYITYYLIFQTNNTSNNFQKNRIWDFLPMTLIYCTAIYFSLKLVSHFHKTILYPALFSIVIAIAVIVLIDTIFWAYFFTDNFTNFRTVFLGVYAILIRKTMNIWPTNTPQ